MKNKIAPTGQERKMRDDDFIVSKTDTTGRLTYANSIFYEFACYKEQQALGQQHNLIRHPDMPRSVFKMLWDTISSGQEFNGYVKNLSSDGGFYWVFANVTPSYDQQNNIIGYYSVRRKPSVDAINVISPIYQDMLAAEKKAGSRDAISVGSALLISKLQQAGVEYEKFVLSI
ncbi:MAG: PAS domain-containing protein [Pseudomonadota bacterium]